MKRLRPGESRARQEKTSKSVPNSNPTGPRVWAPKLSALHMHVLAAQAAKKLDTALHFYLWASPFLPRPFSLPGGDLASPEPLASHSLCTNRSLWVWPALKG